MKANCVIEFNTYLLLNFVTHILKECDLDPTYKDKFLLDGC
jgi:hypothetical protein